MITCKCPFTASTTATHPDCVKFEPTSSQNEFFAASRLHVATTWTGEKRRRHMAHVVEFVERRCCLYGVCVILGPLKHKRGLCLRLFLVNMSTRTPRQLCEGSTGPELLRSLNVLFVTFRVIWLSGRKAALHCARR